MSRPTSPPPLAPSHPLPVTRNQAQRSLGEAGFTLIELLTVIAIIGILAAILIPTLSYARTAANKARTRTQFSQWSAAFESFRQEYGSYPQFPTASASKVVNPTGTSTNPQQVHFFYDTLTGHRRDPAGTWPTTTVNVNGVPPPQVQNARRIQFVAFTDADMVTPADVTNGYNTTAQQYFIRDGFHNTSIAVVTDSNLDGVINGRDSSGGFPGVSAPGTTTPLIKPSTADLPTATTGGIHAGVIFYSAPPNAASDGSDLIMSWK